MYWPQFGLQLCCWDTIHSRIPAPPPPASGLVISMCYIHRSCYLSTWSRESRNEPSDKWHLQTLESQLDRKWNSLKITLRSVSDFCGVPYEAHGQNIFRQKILRRLTTYPDIHCRSATVLTDRHALLMSPLTWFKKFGSRLSRVYNTLPDGSTLPSG